MSELLPGATFVESQKHVKILFCFLKLLMAFRELLISFYCSTAKNIFTQIRKISAKGFLN